MEFKDYYQVLGIPRDADQDAVKRAYRRLARKYHPDVSTEPDAEDKFKEINEAYEVLSNDEKRARYDRFGHAGVNGAHNEANLASSQLVVLGPDFPAHDANLPPSNERAW